MTKIKNYKNEEIYNCTKICALVIVISFFFLFAPISKLIEKKISNFTNFLTAL